MPTNEPLKVDLTKLHDWAIRSGRVYGVRHCAPVAVGSTLAPSRIWDDGDPTDETLDGTCALKLDAYKSHGTHYKHLGSAYLVTGRPSIDYATEDVGEVILRDCRVIALLDIDNSNQDLS